MLDSMKLELELSVTHLMWLQGTELRFPCKSSMGSYWLSHLGLSLLAASHCIHAHAFCLLLAHALYYNVYLSAHNIAPGK